MRICEIFINSRHILRPSSLSRFVTTPGYLNDPCFIATSRTLEAGGHYSRLSGNNYARVRYSHLVAVAIDALGGRWMENHFVRAVRLHVPAKMLIDPSSMVQRASFRETCFSIFIGIQFCTRVDVTRLNIYSIVRETLAKQIMTTCQNECTWNFWLFDMKSDEWQQNGIRIFQIRMEWKI